MRHRRLIQIATAALATALVLFAAAPSWAQGGGWGGGASFVDQWLAAQVGITLTSADAELRPGEGSLAGSNTPPPPRCWYQPGWSAFELVALMDNIWRAAQREEPPIPQLIDAWRQDWLLRVGAHAGEDGLWYYTKCSDYSAIAVFRIANPDPWIWVPTGGPPPPVAGAVITPLALAQYARDSILLPDTAVVLNPAARSTVYLDTWVWLDPTVFRPLSVRAQAGPLVVDAVATPTRLILPGDLPADLIRRDGVCTDLYHAYAKGVNPTCAITFGRSSANQPDLAYTAEFTVVWTVTWTSNWGMGGTLPDGQFADTIAIPVQEVHTIVTDSS